jgi:hypothetical protein
MIEAILAYGPTGKKYSTERFIPEDTLFAVLRQTIGCLFKLRAWKRSKGMV